MQKQSENELHNLNMTLEENVIAARVNKKID